MYQIDDIGSTYASLPPNLQTIDYECLAYAFDRQVKKICDLAKKVTIWSDMDNANPRYYDYMAASIKAPYYKSGYDDQRKLDLLKSTVLSNQYAGTKKSVDNTLSAVYKDEEFVQWFKYNGKPYHFKIKLTDRMESDTLDNIVEILKKVKAIRSKMDAVEADRETSGTVYAGGGINLCHRPAAIIDGYKTDGLADGSTDINGDFTQTYRPTAIMDGYRAEESAGGEYESAVGALGIMNAKAPAIAETLPT